MKVNKAEPETELDLFCIESKDETDNSLELQNFQMPISKIKEAIDQNIRDDVLHSLDVELLPTDRCSEQNKLNDLPGRIWIQETKSVWKQKGLGKEHPHAYYERLHPAPFSFQDAGRLIRFFTKKGERVLDPFCGIGSTLKACAVLNRKGTGIELSPRWAKLATERLLVETGKIDEQNIICADIRDILPNIEDEAFHFMVTSPPYWNILTKNADHKVKNVRLAENLETQYSTDDNDLGNIKDYTLFLEELVKVFRETSKKVINDRYMAIIVSDFRHASDFHPFHSDLYTCLCNHRIKLVGITILEQTHKSLYPYGYPFCYIPNVHHQYILIFRVHHR